MLTKISMFRPLRRKAVFFALAPLAALLPASAAEGVVQGQGASFPSKVYAAWARRFAEVSGIKVSYKPTGSGDGVAQASARKVDFGGTDSPVPEVDLLQRKLIQIPMLVGGVVPVVNVRGVAPNRLQLSGELLAELMLGGIELWNDPRIAALNRGVALPAQRVLRVVRSDRSGTTDGFTRYLAQASIVFRDRVGAGQLPKWPGELLTAEGNDGVTNTVQATPGAIGYVSYDRAGTPGLASVMLRNHDGNMVAASEAGFRAAVMSSELYRKDIDTASLMDMAGAQTWPITLASFVLLDAAPAQAATVEPAMRFLYWCFMRGDDLTRGTGFAALPLSAQARFAARFAQVQPRDGVRPVYQTF